MSTIDTSSLNKLYYSIGEVAKLFNVNASLLRFWEKEFNLTVTKKNKKGNRMYSVKEIEKLDKIYGLIKKKGFTHEGAKKQLKTKDIQDSPQVNNNDELIFRLERIKNQLLFLKS